MDLELADRTAFVAASSKGLGRAIASRLVREGANVAISSRTAEHVAKAKEGILAETGASEEQLLATTCDITDQSAIKEAIEQTASTFGGIDIHVNNHGGPPAITFEEATEDAWREAFQSVILSNVWLSQAALPYLVDSDAGSLITITSASAREPGENHALSNVFRLGLYGLSKTIAIEYGPSVRANCVTPRSVMTERIKYKVERRAEHRGLTVDESLETRREEHLLERMGEPPEFADVVALLASPRASYVTGEVVSVDGGWASSVF